MAIWLASPLALMRLIGGGALLPFVHVPYALFHTWQARKRETKQLLRASWKVPIIFAGWGLVCGLAELAQISISVGEVPALDSFFNGYALGALGLIVGTCFAAMAIPLGIAWLVLLTFARRWPDDERGNTSSAQSDFAQSDSA
jgi:hypothetical protein